jgi:hypothetical protein
MRLNRCLGICGLNALEERPSPLRRE